MRNRNVLIVAALSALSCLAAPAWAKKPPERSALTLGCPASLGAAEQITCLQTENAILKARIERKVLSERLDKPSAGADQRAAAAALPSVLSTFAANGQTQAVLTWSGQGGGSLTVREGQTIPGGWTVQSIAQGRVVIAAGRARHVLFLEGASPAVSQPLTGAAQGAAGLDTFATPPTTIPTFGLNPQAAAAK